MKAVGELVDDKIIVKKSKDVGRFFNKSHFGKTTTGNKLQLDLIEGIFLVDEGKITIYHDKKEVDFQILVKLAANNISHFEIKYLIFKDLRKRGYPVKINKDNKEFDFYVTKQQKESIKSDKSCFISAFSEREIVSIYKCKCLI